MAIPKCCFQARSGNFKIAFARLIAISNARHHYRFNFEFLSFLHPLFEQIGRIAFYDNFGFKIDARPPAQIFMGRSRVTIATAVSTASIGIQAEIEMDVRTVVSTDNRL